MNQIACQYAIIRFAPFIETGEFANIGIIMMSPKHRYYGFQLEIKRHGRITRFFDDIDSSVYRRTVYNLKDELERVADLLKPHGFDKRLKHNDVDYSTELFNEITRTRETIIRFSEVRTILTSDPKIQLKELFSYYVERNFITKEYKETLLEKNIRQLLYKANIGDRFVKEKIGDDAYHVSFPFVEQKNDRTKVIKPLHLGHEESTNIYNHGGQWVFKINQLRKKRLLKTKNILFALSGPKTSNHNSYEAYTYIKNSLLDTGVEVISYENHKQDIIKFATN